MEGCGFIRVVRVPRAGSGDNRGHFSVRRLEGIGEQGRVFTERLANTLTSDKIGWTLKVKYYSNLNLICL